MRLHACPGQCGTQVPHRHLACLTCWHRLPQPLRDDIKATYHRDMANHWAALRAASQWYRDNPRETTDA